MTVLELKKLILESSATVVLRHKRYLLQVL